MPAFVAAYALTAVALVGVVWSGFRRRRHLHYTLVVATLACLAAAIHFAKIMGRGFAYEGAAATVRTVHFTAVAVTLALILVLVATGVRLARARDEGEPDARRLHRRVAFAFLAAVAVTTALGITMTALATPA